MCRDQNGNGGEPKGPFFQFIQWINMYLHDNTIGLCTSPSHLYQAKIIYGMKKEDFLGDNQRQSNPSLTTTTCAISHIGI